MSSALPVLPPGTLCGAQSPADALREAVPDGGTGPGPSAGSSQGCQGCPCAPHVLLCDALCGAPRRVHPRGDSCGALPEDASSRDAAGPC